MYRTEIQLDPTITDGVSKYYWQVYVITSDGSKLTVKHGYGASWKKAFDQCLMAVYSIKTGV